MSWRHGLELKWYKYTPKGVAEKEAVKILGDINSQRDNVIQARRSNVIASHKESKEAVIVDIVVSAETRIAEKEL